MTDLFTHRSPVQYDPAPNCDDEYRRALLVAAIRDTATCRDRGQLHLWTGEDDVLQEDEYRLIQAAYENPVRWSNVNRLIQMEAVMTMGLNQIGNARAVIVKCIRLGYINAVYSPTGACELLQATDRGVDKLEERDDFVAWGIL